MYYKSSLSIYTDFKKNKIKYKYVLILKKKIAKKNK